MKDFLAVIRPEEVQSAQTFAEYCQQRIGTPMPSRKDCMLLNKKLKAFLNSREELSYGSLVRLVEWARSRGKRPAQPWLLLDWSRYAWQDGYLPELDAQEPVDKLLESKIAMALRVEQDPVWRDKLMHSKTIEMRQTIFDGWWRLRRPMYLERIASGQ